MHYCLCCLCVVSIKDELWLNSYVVNTQSPTLLTFSVLVVTRRPCSDFMDMLRRLINYRIIIIITHMIH